MKSFIIVSVAATDITFKGRRSKKCFTGCQHTVNYLLVNLVNSGGSNETAFLIAAYFRHMLK